jgi:hypothetical protein
MVFFEPWLIAPISSLFAILLGFYLFLYVKKEDGGTQKMREIAKAIHEGSRSFLKTEYKYARAWNPDILEGKDLTLIKPPSLVIPWATRLKMLRDPPSIP